MKKFRTPNLADVVSELNKRPICSARLLGNSAWNIPSSPITASWSLFQFATYASRLGVLIFFFLITLLLTSCQQSYLTVQTDYLSYKNLASYYVGTPDPRMDCPPIGQRLIISWSVWKEMLACDDLHLEITIRFRNRKEWKENFHILKKRGTYVYTLLNNDYIDKQGILCYKVELVGNGCVIEEWRHQIWTELIEIEHDTTPRPELPFDEFQIDWEE
ncbi:MAG: hypothetical protein WCG42_08665 [Parachlamydiaceae bacterium]